MFVNFGSVFYVLDSTILRFLYLRTFLKASLSWLHWLCYHINYTIGLIIFSKAWRFTTLFLWYYRFTIFILLIISISPLYTNWKSPENEKWDETKVGTKPRSGRIGAVTILYFLYIFLSRIFRMLNIVNVSIDVLSRDATGHFGN